jgi:hypothetical protein
MESFLGSYTEGETQKDKEVEEERQVKTEGKIYRIDTQWARP